MDISPATAGAGALIPVMEGIPGPWGLLAVLLYCTFVLHLLVMNAVVGVAVITLITRLKAALWPVPGTITGLLPAFESDVRTQASFLPKGIAILVNLGVPPLLFVQGLYGRFIYPASILMALWWLSVMLVVMLAYYGMYVNTATRTLSTRTRTTALAVSVILLLANAFILVNNATLMQAPGNWAAYADNAKGTLLNFEDPQLFPRYLHFFLSTLAVGGLCLALPAHFQLRSLARSNAPLPMQDHVFSRMRSGLRWFMHATLLQIIVGGWFLLSLPRPQQALFMGKDAYASAGLVAALFLTGFALLAAKRERPVQAAGAALFVILLMAGLRTLLRSSFLEPYAEPVLRPFEAGPLWLFTGAVVFSALVLFKLAHLYRKPYTAPVIPAAAAESEDDAIPMQELGSYAEIAHDDEPQEEPDDEPDDEPENAQGGNS